ncbi:MAG: hypothetical protein GW858_05760 [Sphingomonadales bacterium]|nr:hypothetical protein [Sphingomonadales bacterium]NCQ20717.1 hypothetical protein [Sphingomonadales bacterium]NCT03715.1 hypothetical protein [Sphingomonadales bacterium]
MRFILSLLAIGGAAYALTRKAGRSASGNAAYADGQPRKAHDDVRDAGPDAMRDPPSGRWSEVDQASDQSFPASDPPGNY